MMLLNMKRMVDLPKRTSMETQALNRIQIPNQLESTWMHRRKVIKLGWIFWFLNGKRFKSEVLFKRQFLSSNLSFLVSLLCDFFLSLFHFAAAPKQTFFSSGSTTRRFLFSFSTERPCCFNNVLAGLRGWHLSIQCNRSVIIASIISFCAHQLHPEPALESSTPLQLLFFTLAGFIVLTTYYICCITTLQRTKERTKTRSKRVKEKEERRTEEKNECK